jgi:hypothetical protein
VNHDKTVISPYLNGSTEAIHLIAAETSDAVDFEEHDVATGCPKEGIVKFTGVPGVLSGYQLLMKPVVFITMNHGGEGTIRESSFETKENFP